MRLYRWNPDARGTTPAPVPGAYAVVRSGIRLMPWSVCVVVKTASGHDLENVADLRTVRDCKEWILARA